MTKGIVYSGTLISPVAKVADTLNVIIPSNQTTSSNIL
jgi:hypothetical protein